MLYSRLFPYTTLFRSRLDGERKNIIYEVERLRQRRNSASEDIAKLLREKVEVTDKRNEMKLVSQQIKDKEEALRTVEDRKSTRLNSSHVAISYAVFCL